MAVEMFLRIDGITGGSKNFYHKGWSDMSSWKWGMASTRTAAQATTSAATSFNQISLIKPVGMDSAAIMSLYAEGRIAAKGEINVVPVVTKREAQVKYVSILMEDLMIKSIDVGGSVDDNQITETITLLFGKIKFDFNQYGDAGPDTAAAESVSHSFAWNVEQNRAS